MIRALFFAAGLVLAGSAGAGGPPPDAQAPQAAQELLPEAPTARDYVELAIAALTAVAVVGGGVYARRDPRVAAGLLAAKFILGRLHRRKKETDDAPPV